MRPRFVVLGCLLALLASGALASSALAQTEPTRKTLRTWSYVGPGAELAGAKISLIDRTGRVIARGTTTRRGTWTFDVSNRSSVRMPLTIRTSGGRARGVAFTGQLRARAFVIGPASPIVDVSLVSTAASMMATSRAGYDRALRKARRSLGLHPDSLPRHLRVNDREVGYVPLMRLAKRKGGFDALAAYVADMARAGTRISGLRPARRARGAAPRQSSTTSAMCGVPTPSGGSTTSDEVITDVVDIGAGALMKAAGLPTNAAAGVAGMALAPLGIQTNPEEAQLTQIEADLTCISRQISALYQQMQALQFATDLAGATACSSGIDGTNGFPGYEYLLANRGQYPVNSSNTSLTIDYLPAWQSITNACGAAINNMLFGTSGGQASTWQQLVKNTQGSAKWLGQAQVQALQTFLAYWGSMLYQQFILTNEFANYYGTFEAAQQASGAATSGGKAQVGSNGQVLCADGSTATTSSYCVWSNNIAKAYPADLYSDEVGIVSTGAAVNAIPGGMVAPNPFATTYASGMASTVTALHAPQTAGNAPTAMNPGWFYNYFLNFTPYTGKATNQLKLYTSGGAQVCLFYLAKSCPLSKVNSTDFYTSSITWFNKLGLNPQKLGSAQQLYNNPQATNRTGVEWSEVSSALGSNGPTGQTPAQAFYAGINQQGALKQITSGEMVYMTDDTSNYFIGLVESGTSVDVGWAGVLGDSNTKTTWFTSPSTLPSTPVFAFLTQRSWWGGAATAATYVPPAPPTPSNPGVSGGGGPQTG